MKVTWGGAWGSEWRPRSWWMVSPFQGQEDRKWSRYQRGSAEFRSGHVTFKPLVKQSNTAIKEVDGTVG